MKANLKHTKNYCLMLTIKKFRKNLKKLNKWLKKCMMNKK